MGEPMPVVTVPPPYQGPTQGKAEVPVEGATVGECLEAVDRLYPGFGPQIFENAGSVHSFVKLFVNGEPIEITALDTPVGPADEVGVIAAIAGGA